MSASNTSGTNLTLEHRIPESGCFHQDPLGIKLARILPYLFFIVVSLVGNSMVVAVVLKNQKMRTTVNFYIVNMAVADLAITLYMPRMVAMAFTGYEWQVKGAAGSLLCKFSILFNQIPMTVSILTVVAISFDRFNAVVFPLRTCVSLRFCAVSIVCTWLAALVIRFPTIMSVQTMTGRDGKVYCNLLLDNTFGAGSQKVYYQFTMIAVFTLPFITIVVLYSAIIVTLKRAKTPGLTPENSSNDSQGFRRREVVKKKVLRMVSIVVLAFILCWFLYYVRLSMFAYGIDFSCDLLFTRLFLAHANSALNPCFYAGLSENYRRGFRELLSKLKCPKFGRDSVGRPLGAWDSNGSISIRMGKEIQNASTL